MTCSFLITEEPNQGMPTKLFGSRGTMYLLKIVAWRLCEIASEVYGGIGGPVDMPLDKFVHRVFLFSSTWSDPTMEVIKSSMEYKVHKIE